jgi:hypothetical protein
MKVLLEEVYRTQFSLHMVGLLVLATAPLLAILVGALVARVQPSPRSLAMFNLILQGATVVFLI